MHLNYYETVLSAMHLRDEPFRFPLSPLSTNSRSSPLQTNSIRKERDSLMTGCTTDHTRYLFCSDHARAM